MASDEARKLVEEMLSGTGTRRAEISSGEGNKGTFPGTKRFESTAEPPPEDPWHQRLLEVAAPTLASTLVGGPIGAGAARALGAGGRLGLGAGRGIGETLAAAGAGATGVLGGTPGVQGAAEGALGNILGLGMGAAAGPLARRIPGVRGGWFGDAVAGAREADLLLRGEGKEGLLLSQAFDSPLAQNAERIFSEAMIAGRGALGRAGQRANQASRELTEQYVSGLINTGGRQEVGEAVEGFLTNKYDVFRAASSARYQAVDELAKGVVVDIAPLQSEAARLMKNGEIVGGGAATVLKNIIGRPSQVSFSEAAKLRSSLLSIGREGDAILPEQASAFAKKLAPTIEREMDKAANVFNPATGGSTSPAAWRAYLDARDFHRRGVEPFNNDAIRAIMRRDPEAVAQYLVPLSGNFKTSAIQALRRISGNDPTAMDALRSHYVSELLRGSRREAVDVLERATNPASTRYVSGEKLLDSLNKDTKGLQELLGTQGYQRLLGLASAMARTEKAPGAKGQATLGTAIKYARIIPLAGGAISFQLGGPQVGAGTAMLLTVAPNAVNHVLASPTLRAWLIGGKAIPPGSKTFSRGVGQIISHSLAGQRKFGKDAITIQPGEAPPENTGPYRPPEGPMSFQPNDLLPLAGGR